MVNTPELEVKPPNKVFLAAMSTPSTVPVTARFPVTSTPEVLILNRLVGVIASLLPEDTCASTKNLKSFAHQHYQLL